VLAALGSTEKHGAHIPLGTDSHVTMEVVKRAAAAADVLYSPLVPFGYSPHHMGRHLKGAGSITLRAETYRRIMSDITRSLIFHGFKRIVFVSHHGSNTKPIDEVMRQLRYDTGAFISYYKTPTERDASVIQDLFDNPPEETPGWHSSELETSALMATSDCLVSRRPVFRPVPGSRSGSPRPRTAHLLSTNAARCSHIRSSICSPFSLLEWKGLPICRWSITNTARGGGQAHAPGY
jgi:creatinine amidohydrolase